MSKLVLGLLGMAAVSLSGCNGGNGDNSGATNGAQGVATGETRLDGDDANHAGQLNSGMEPAVVPADTSGGTMNQEQPRR